MGYMILRLSGKITPWNTNLGVISLWMECETIRQDEITKGHNINNKNVWVKENDQGQK